MLEIRLESGMLQDVRNECAVLERTEVILKSRDSNLKEYLEELERKKGVLRYICWNATLRLLCFMQLAKYSTMMMQCSCFD